MVTTAFLLFTVSTLTAHINAVPTKLFNHDPCEGKPLCFEKAADYPQEEEMDHMVANSDMRQFYRVKRDIREANGNSIEDTRNSCVYSYKPPMKQYGETDIEGIIRDIVETKSFSQLLPEIKCKTTKPCFEQFEKNSMPLFGCQPVISRVNLTMHTKGHKGATIIEHDITTDCRCGLRK